MADASSFRFPVPAATAAAPHRSQLAIRRSRFLAQACECGSREACRAFVEQARAANPDATHHCWAFAAGPPGDRGNVGCSDDGEPHGAAGRPMLNALLHSGVGRICCVVSRWFGGIKLGAGGLARAYQDSVLENLKDLPLAMATPRGSWRLEAGYGCLDAVQRLLPQFEAELISGEYGEAALLLISAPLDRREELEQALAGASGGAVKLTEAAP